jgi:hypothetical protein
MEAWSEIRGKDDAVAHPGDTVTASGLGLTDEEFQALVDEGAVREAPFPKELPEGQSPTEYAKQQLTAMAEAGVAVTPEQVAAAKEGATKPAAKAEEK